MLNPMEVELMLREAQPSKPFPHAADRAAWASIREKLGEEQAVHFVRLAEEALVEPISFLPASLWLECQRTGERGGYETPAYRRRTMLRDLLIGECLEGQGRYLDKLMDVTWAICEESSWAYPAHHTQLADMARPYIDLGAASTGFELAEADSLIGDLLPPEVGQRVRYEIDQRLFKPYLERHDFWWLYNTRLKKVNNWTAVCNAGVMASAIYLEETPSRLAEILVKGARSMEDYITTFDEDGGSSEGPGYWTYGFGYYTLIAHLVEHRTAGQMSLMNGELIRKIVAFPLRAQLSQGMYVNFSDAPRYATFVSPMLVYLAERMDLPDLIQLAKEQPPFTARPEMSWLLRGLVWDIPQPDGTRFTPAKHDWYNGMMWMFSRYNPDDSNTLVLAAKGGHNDEMHNHNDVGNFIVHVHQESIIADVGAGRYTLQYFGPNRYDHFSASSLGHSVPVVNGQVQKEGKRAAAQLLEHTHSEKQDVLHLEMKDAYPPEAGLASLRRKLVFHREEPAGWVELIDSFDFLNEPGAFESALTTFGDVMLGDDAVVIHGERGKLRVGYDSNVVRVQVDLYQGVDLSDGQRDVYRVSFTLSEPMRQGTIRLEIVPV